MPGLELQAMGTILRAAIIERDQGARDWLHGRCTIGINEGGAFLDYGLRNGPDALAWSTAIYERDGYRCTACGGRGRLHAHHIEGWAAAPQRRFDLSNGTTLCIECHADQHPEHAALIRKARYHRGPSN